jgi:PEP-CTERM motif-containing protein
MNKFIITGSMVMAVLVLAASRSSAQIAAWDVQGTGSPAVVTLAATTFDPNLSAAPVLGRVDVGGTAAANSFNSSNWNITATLATNDNYLTFTVNAAAGYTLNMTSLSYAMNGSNTAPGNDQWGFSSDGGATWTMEPTFNVHNPQVSSLSNWDFADVSVTSVEFRFWAYGTNSIAGGTSSIGGTTRINNIAGNDLILNGTVTAVPEPSTLSMIGLGLFGMLAFARRRFSRS